MTAHRHKGLTGKWITLLGGDGAHTHPAAGHMHPEFTALDTRLDAIEAWIATHEDAPEPPPVPPPADVPDMAAGALQALVNGAASGSTVVVPLGRYHELLTVTKPLHFQFSPGCEITGDGTRAEWVRVQASDVTFERAASADPRPALWCHDAAAGGSQMTSFNVMGVQRFTGRNLRMTLGQASILGMRDGADHVFEDCEFEQGRQSLFSVNKITRFTFRRCRFHHATGTLPGFDPGFEGGAGKFGGWASDPAQVGSSGALFEDCEVHDIVGFGLWADVRGNDAIWRRCRIRDVQATGIFFEVSENALIEDCIVYRCGRTNPQWGYGAGILSSSSRRVIARRNLVYDCARGIVAISQNRMTPGLDFNPGMTGVEVYDNTIIATRPSDLYLSGFMRDWADPAFYDGTSRAYGNRYWHPAAEPTPNGRFARSRQSGNPYDHDYARLADYATLFGDTTSRYLTDAEKDAALTAAGII